MSAALMQWAGRTHVLIAVTCHTSLADDCSRRDSYLGVGSHRGYPMPFVCSFTELPGWLNWLRYTIFIPLYPIRGGLSEAKVRWNPSNHAEKMYSISMPNAYNFAFDYTSFVKVVLVLYPFLFYQLYAYMFVQRKKKLGQCTVKRKTSSYSY